QQDQAVLLGRHAAGGAKIGDPRDLVGGLSGGDAGQRSEQTNASDEFHWRPLPGRSTSRRGLPGIREPPAFCTAGQNAEGARLGIEPARSCFEKSAWPALQLAENLRSIAILPGPSA